MVTLADLLTAYNFLVASSFFFLAEQILLLIIMYRDDAGWKLRFSRDSNYHNLKPIQATVKITAIIFFISVIIFPILSMVFFDKVVGYASCLRYGILGFFSLMCGTFFFIWHYLVGKKWNPAQIAIVASQAILIALLLYLSYFI